MSTITTTSNLPDLATRLASLQPALAGNSRAEAALASLIAQTGGSATGNNGSGSSVATDLSSIAQANQEAALNLITDPTVAAATTAQVSLQFLAPGGSALAAQAPTASAGLLALLGQN